MFYEKPSKMTAQEYFPFQQATSTARMTTARPRRGQNLHEQNGWGPVSGMMTSKPAGMTTTREIHLHLVSDSTGETTHQLARAALAQFRRVKTTEHVWTLVRTEQHLQLINESIINHGGVVLYSISDRGLRQQLELICRQQAVPAVSVLDHVIHTFSKVLGKPEDGVIGGQHRMDAAYFGRMEALEFAISHDDGLGMDNLGQAEILLVGVSRSSKTPTSIYLANRGYRVANYPLVPGVSFPHEKLQKHQLLVVGLIKDARSLTQIRRNRLAAMRETKTLDYADPARVKAEISEARKLFTNQRWPVIDVTRKSVEETAAEVINLYNNRLEKQHEQ